MNLRIAPEHIRVRISEEELSQLLQQGSITHATRMSPQWTMTYTLRLAGPMDPTSQTLLRMETQPHEHGVHCLLLMCDEAIALLCAPETQKEGIRTFIAFDQGDLLTIDLAVDLHSKKGRSA